MWKMFAERDRAQMIIWCKRVARWIPKAMNTHSEYVIIIAFPQEQSLHESASQLRYTYNLPALLSILRTLEKSGGSDRSSIILIEEEADFTAEQTQWLLRSKIILGQKQLK